ncbi:MAG TPA: BON domain-containing protein, partial [Terracidiphilus sp.]|nr:BON domain-containing protein [Terracidiphilus sp.]
MRKTESARTFRAGSAALAVLALAAMLAAGCKQSAPAQNDQQLASSVQSKIQGESALNGQNIQVSVSNGVATLSGTAADDASRALAGNDAGSVPGVRTVVNNLTVQPAQQAQAEVPAKPTPEVAAPAAAPERTRESRDRSRRNAQNASNGGQDYNGANLPPGGAQPAQPMPQQQAQAAPAPPPPPQPVARQVAIPAGTSIPIRLVDAVSTKTAQPNDVFHASVAQDVV